MFYRIKENKLYDYADYKYAEDCLETKLITRYELDKDKDKVIIENGIVVLNPNYNEILNQREAERISRLKCTKRVFILMLEQLGFDYFEQIVPLIESDRQAKLEWELCVELERSNPLLDILARRIGVSSEQLDDLFKYANGEILSLRRE